MENELNFRFAFHGFNQDDVVRYLQAQDSRHAIELGQCQDDLARVTAQLNELRSEQMIWNARFEEVASEKTVMQQKIDELTAALDEATDPENSRASEEVLAENDELKARIRELETQLNASEQRNSTLEEQLHGMEEELNAATRENDRLFDENQASIRENARLTDVLRDAEQEAAPDVNYREMELLAYRRAESVERQARNRARQTADQVTVLAEKLRDQLINNRHKLAEVTDTIGSALELLQTTLDSSCAALEEGSLRCNDLKGNIPED